jgi:murein DD-endopeptidase MepM/ murein hydrolase activator NlpD
MSVPLNPTVQTQLSPTYLDLGGQISSPEQVAQEFESLFLAQLLTIMQESVESSGLFDGGPGKEVYSAMMNQELGRALAAGGGIGLSKLLEPYMTSKTNSVGPNGTHPVPDPTEQKKGDGNVSASMPDFVLSSNLGWRKDPFSGEWRYHRGVDFAAPRGTEVRSLSSGRVIFAGSQGGYGNMVVVESEHGVKTRYAHLSEMGVKKGEEVSQGQEIGKVGETGRATGPHLHLEMERSGKLLDPLRAEAYL